MKDMLVPLSAAFLVFLVFSYTLQWVAFDRSFYDAQYEKNGIYARFIPDEVNNVTDELLQYLQDEKSDIATLFFNSKEKEHLRDVKRLLQRERLFGLWMTVLFGVLLAIRRQAIQRIMTLAGLLGGGVIAILGLLISLSFPIAFTLFHLLLFTNDLWMLDPETDRLVMLYPEPFWIAIALRWALLMAISYSLILTLGVMEQRR
ncbi:TIGR01906 family membrane protein [Candidatus Woesearchaeota archaeon]|nr:TIGR01906 family membrane protein [Candidatus Woesearchaeota archaeon]